jgi:hypothetical protein
MSLSSGQSYALYVLFGAVEVETVDGSGNPTSYSTSYFRQTVNANFSSGTMTQTQAFWNAVNTCFSFDVTQGGTVPMPTVNSFKGGDIRAALGNITYNGSGNPCPDVTPCQTIYNVLVQYYH